MMDDDRAALSSASLPRVIGVRGVASASFNGIVGAGIFGLPALVAGVLGPAALIAYAICLLLVALMGLCFAESGSRVTRPGGFYSFALAAFGPVTAGMIGILTIFANLIASSAALSRFMIDALSVIWPWVGGAVPGTIFLACFYAVLALVNVHGARDGARFTAVMAAVKIAPLVLLVAAGMFFIDPANLAMPEMPGIVAIAQGAMLLVFAFMGMESGLNIGGEARDPARTVPRAILLALTLVGALYIGLQLVSQGVLGAALAGEKAPLIAAASQVFGPWGMRLMLVTTVLSAGGYLVSDMLGGPRVPFALAQQGQLPAILARVHPRHGTPYVAIVAYAILSFVLAASGTFRQLVILATSGSLLIYLVCCLGVLRLRARGVAMAGPPFVAPGGALVPIAAAAIIVALLSTLDWGELAAGAGLAAIGAAGYWLAGLWRTRI